ncbi:BUD13 homolog isoform X2 [Pimephales promelas]|uniref:BUD13 homolog isoform X2 n=1 Tax=Pimephales promelas TaxID=90988 RepID=UPI001955B1CC|nr:BUD13 homolog isoform X2 [Pimephales promelas]
MSSCFRSVTSYINKMATSTGISKGAAFTKADYLKRYLSNDEAGKKSKEKKVKKKRPKPTGRGMKIVDDDIDWRQLARNEEENKDEEEDDEAPVIADVIDERPDEIKQLEVFRTSKWKVLGEQDLQETQDSPLNSRVRHDSPESSTLPRGRHDSPDLSPKRLRHDSPNLSPLRRGRHDSPDLSLKRHVTENKNRWHDSSSPSPPRKSLKSSPSRTQKQHDKGSTHRKKTSAASSGDLSPPRRRARTGRGSDSDQSPPRRRPRGRRGSDSDQSPPRKRGQGGRGSDSDLSPPRKKPQGGRGSDSDLSPPRRTHSPDAAPRMLSGGAAGLVSVDVLRKEQEEIRRKEKRNKPLEEASRNAETIFRDKSGRVRDLESERIKLSKEAGEKAEKDEKYAQWGKGLAQGEMQQQNLTDAMREAQKPLARHIDDEDLDRMLREQERDGDPMAAMLRKKKAKNAQLKGIKEKPRYKGPPPPPNRFNLVPGYRWDGVDRSNGFEQKRYNRISDKKAVQEMAYKWSVEDM